uniref:Uncharacterized protein n=1 Tax=Anopheles quadriannulatus TaxID=34691 RepID=A0A182XS18_ANOQN
CVRRCYFQAPSALPLVHLVRVCVSARVCVCVDDKCSIVKDCSSQNSK